MTSESTGSAIPSVGHVVIEASAGTGKTYTIENLVASLVTSGGLELSQVLVVTFTEKAKEELRLRIEGRLRSHAEGDARTEDPWRAAKDAALAQFESASIMTIHAFCHRILSQEAFAMGLPFGGVQVASRPAFRRALADALRGELATREPAKSFLREALTSGMGVGAFEQLLWDAHRYESVVPVVDVARIASEARRLAPLLAVPGSIDTALRSAKVHHATAKKLSAQLHALSATFAEFGSQGDVPRLLLRAERAFERSYIEEKLGPVGEADFDVLRLRSAALEAIALLPPFDAALVQLFLPVVRATLRAGKADVGGYDFDDMLRFVADRVESLEGESLVSNLRKRFKVALIDEFQDTDDVQWRIFRKLFFDGTKEHRLILVGDPKQAIYGFRGADVFTYLRAKEEVLAAGGAFRSLDFNYRSTAPLISSYNAIIGGDSAAPLLSGSIRYERPVACGRPDLGLRGAAGEEAPPVVIFEQQNAPAERRGLCLVSSIASEIGRITGSHGLHFCEGGAALPITYRDILVLTRSRSECALVCDELGGAGIPCRLGQQAGLFDSAEAAHVRDLLLALEAPEDRGRRGAVFLTPFFDLSLEAVAAHAGEGATSAGALLVEWSMRAEARKWPELFEQILEESGVLRRAILTGTFDSVGRNIRHLLELLSVRASQRRLPLREVILLLEGLMEERLPDEPTEQERATGESDAVRVMTMHASKGLEAKVVFLFGGFEATPSQSGVRAFHDANGRRAAWVGEAPSDVKGLVAKEEREEEERLSYVALTRAKGRLYLPYLFEHAKDGSVVASRLRGTYGRIHARLAELRKGGAGFPPSWAVMEVPAELPAEAPRVTLDALARWSPPPALLSLPDPDRTRFAFRYETSYSRLRKRAEDVLPEVSLVSAVRDPSTLAPPALLARGMEAGTHLHSLLEEVALESLRKHDTFDAWWSEAPVRAPFYAAAMRLGVDPSDDAVAREAGALVYRAYTTPLLFRDDGASVRLAHATRLAREVRFGFVPRGTAASGGDPAGDTAATADVPGVVRGVIDALVEHDGLLWIVEWKSDSLPNYSRDTLAEHVVLRYSLQAAVYSLAVAKELGFSGEAAYAERMGGVVFVFVRALLEPGAAEAAAYPMRPSWESLTSLEAELAERGGAS